MGIMNPIKAAVKEFKKSVFLTKQLAKKIVEHDKDGSTNKDDVKEDQKRDNKTKGNESKGGTTENIR